MTVREVMAVLKEAKRFSIAWNGCLIPIDPDNDLTMAAFGDFKVAHIQNSFELETYEIEIATKFIKEVKA